MPNTTNIQKCGMIRVVVKMEVEVKIQEVVEQEKE